MRDGELPNVKNVDIDDETLELTLPSGTHLPLSRASSRMRFLKVLSNNYQR